MSLEESALNYIRSLGTPWHGLFQTVAGLNLASLKLKDDLLTERSIDRTQPGFGDFDPASRRAIVPGDPASSFLYHALASPLVKPASAAVTYPQVADLDLIENYILSLAPLPTSAHSRRWMRARSWMKLAMSLLLQLAACRCSRSCLGMISA